MNAAQFVNSVRTAECPTGIGRAPGGGEIDEPPLAFAVWPTDQIGRQYEVASLLLESGADPNGIGDTVPLMRARTSAMVVFLSKHGGNLDRQGPNGETALIVAAKLQNIAVVRALVGCGASVSLRDKWGNSALDLVSAPAMPLGSVNYVTQCREVLIQHGAKLYMQLGN